MFGEALHGARHLGSGPLIVAGHAPDGERRSQGLANDFDRATGLDQGADRDLPLAVHGFDIGFFGDTLRVL